MKQTQKTLLGAGVLFAVLVVVGGAALWVKKDDLDKEEAKEKEARLVTVDKQKVRTLRLEKAGQLVAEASREADGKPWKLSKPVQTDADQSAVNALLDRLADLKQKKDLGSDVDAKQSGLAVPRVKIAAVLDDKQEQAIELGAENPFDSSLYVRKAGEKNVGITDGQQFANFDKSLFDLRDKSVAHLEPGAEVGGFTIGNEDPYTLTKQGTVWKLTGPGHEQFEDADQAGANRTLDSIRNLRATGVAAETADAAALKKYGLDESAKDVIELTLGPASAKDAKRRIVTIGQPKPEAGQVAVKTFAKRDDAPTVFEIDNNLVKDLQKTWFDLQDKTVVKFDREQVRALEIDAPGAGRIVVSRSKDAAPDAGVAEEKFAIVEPVSGVAKKAKVTGTLLGLAGLKAAAFVEDSKGPSVYGLDKARSYTLKGEAGKVLARLRIGHAVPKNDKRVYVQADGGPVVEVEKATVDDLAKTPGEVLEPAAPPEAAPAPPRAQGGPPK